MAREIGEVAVGGEVGIVGSGQWERLAFRIVGLRACMLSVDTSCAQAGTRKLVAVVAVVAGSRGWWRRWRAAAGVS